MSGLPSSSEHEELMKDKIIRKSKEQPLVPIGCVATATALIFAAKAVRQGNSRLANHMFRWRVGLQAGTLLALVAGGFMIEKNRPDPEELKRQKAKEREKLWIEELERIDQESKDRQKRAQSIQEAFLQRREESKKQEELKKGGKGDKSDKE